MTPLSLSRRLRRLPALFPPPSDALHTCIVVPARDEELRLPGLVHALAAQRTASGEPFAPGSVEVLVLLNNCTDGSAQALADASWRAPGLTLHAASVRLDAPEAHVGRARQWLMDEAYARLGGRGLVLTTDADSRPAPGWIAANAAEVAAGADLVGGRVQLLPEERAALPHGVRRYFLLDIGYRRALERLASLYLPDAADPYPRHHQHYGASLAVTAEAYGRAGGMPLVRSSEDVALVRAVQASGGRVRHSLRARVFTSARTDGRASGGLADAFCWWADQVHDRRPVWVESAEAAERRIAAASRCDGPIPTVLLSPPEPAAADAREPIERALQGLRERIATVAALSPQARSDRARRLAPSLRLHAAA